MGSEMCIRDRLTFTKFYGLDPEREGDGRAAVYPQNRICSFGLNVEF